MEHLHKPYLFMPLGPGKGQILWTERRPGQRFLTTYPPFIFVCVEINSRPLNQRFFNNVFTTYLCIREMSRTAIEDKP